jgi:hypothetical protein
MRWPWGAGAPGRVTHIDWRRRRCYVEPTDLPARSPWQRAFHPSRSNRARPSDLCSWASRPTSRCRNGSRRCWRRIAGNPANGSGDWAPALGCVSDGGTAGTRVVVIRRYLVVANRPCRPQNCGKSSARRSAQALFLLRDRPHTKAAEYDAVAVGGVLFQPGMWWRATFKPAPSPARRRPRRRGSGSA